LTVKQHNEFCVCLVMTRDCIAAVVYVVNM